MIDAAADDADADDYAASDDAAMPRHCFRFFCHYATEMPRHIAARYAAATLLP